jgi:hypothetical protein
VDVCVVCKGDCCLHIMIIDSLLATCIVVDTISSSSKEAIHWIHRGCLSISTTLVWVIVKSYQPGFMMSMLSYDANDINIPCSKNCMMCFRNIDFSFCSEGVIQAVLEGRYIQALHLWSFASFLP